MDAVPTIWTAHALRQIFVIDFDSYAKCVQEKVIKNISFSCQKGVFCPVHMVGAHVLTKDLRWSLNQRSRKHGCRRWGGSIYAYVKAIFSMRAETETDFVAVGSTE